LPVLISQRHVGPEASGKAPKPKTEATIPTPMSKSNFFNARLLSAFADLSLKIKLFYLSLLF